MPSTFTDWLRYWRKRRGMSQLDLALTSEVSQRHISFLESGRSQPSREMVLKLAMDLEIPLLQRNAMLLAAGFAPVFQQRDWLDPDLSAARQAFSLMLEQHQPYPGTVVDQVWNLVMVNAPAARMIDWLLGPIDQRDPDIATSTNAAMLTLHPNGMRPYIENWEAVAAQLLHDLQRQANTEPPGESPAAELLAQLRELPGLPDMSVLTQANYLSTPVLTVNLVHEDERLQLITTVASLGTSHDITLRQLRAELVYPADDATRRWFEDHAE